MGYWLSINFSPGQQDIVNNRTYMTVYLSVHASNGYYAEHTNASGTLNINGVDYPFSGHYRVNGSSQIIHSVGVWIPHNQDGSKIVYAVANFNTRVVGVLTASNSVTLTTIPRASSPTTSKSTVTFGESFDILTHRKSNNFTHDVYVMANNDPASYTKIADKIPTDTSWTLPESWKKYFPTAEIKLLVRVFTFNGSTPLGRIDAPLITIRPTPDMYPVAEIEEQDETDCYMKYGGYVKLQSKIKIAVKATYKYGAAHKSTKLKIQGNGSTEEQKTEEQNIVPKGDKINIEAIITDSRDTSVTAIKELQILDWHAPVLTDVKMERCTINGDADANGNYIKILYTADIASVNEKNKKEIVYELVKQGEYDSVYESEILQNYKMSGSKVLPCHGDFAWNIKIALKDDFTISDYTQQIGTAFTLVDYHESGTGIAHGKVAEHKNLFDINLPTKFRKSIEINNYNLADYIISRESINKDGIDWTVVKYASGDMHAWGNGKITFSAGDYTQWSAYWWRKVIFVNLPVPFYKLISVMVQGAYNGRVLSTNDFFITDNAEKFEVHRYSTQNITVSETSNAHFEVKGKWK